MGAPSYTYTLTNGTTADATQVMQNFNDILNGVTDGTKNLNISALTAAGTATLNGNAVLGASSANTLTINAALASTIAIGTDATYDIGGTTKGLRAIYLGANSQRLKIQASASQSASWTLTTPVTAGSANQFLKGDGSGNLSWVNISPTVQTFISSTGIYTTPAGVLWIRVRLVGGGGGGAGSGTGSNGAGGTGGNTTFGTTLLSGSGGGGAAGGVSQGGVGGAASLGSGPIGFAVTGGSGSGSGSTLATTTAVYQGGPGAASPFGGAGGGGLAGTGNGPGQAGATNSGSGGGGGGAGNNANSNNGGGGGAGGYVDAIITSVSGSYAYVVGGAGAFGSAGTNGNAGGAGGSGYIIVEEHYS